MDYKIVYKGGVGEIIEKKSRFIATIHPVESEDEATAFIEAWRKRYWDATHNCYAYVIGTRNEIARCSDDGEPAQTAGRPMLDVLLGEEIHNAAVVVTRYFGGTLLGTGGLVRAYSRAVQEGLKNCQVVTKELCHKVVIDSDYNALGKIQYIAASMEIPSLDCVYSDRVQSVWLVKAHKKEDFVKKVTQATSALAKIEISDPCYGGFFGKEAMIFE